MTHQLRSVSSEKRGPGFNPQLLVLLVLLTAMVVFHFAVWGFHRTPEPPEWHVPVARPERGPDLIREYGCGACHTVPGVREATGKVGPRLDRVGEQVYIAGVLANSPQNLADWIRHPRRADPHTAMPDVGVGAEDARDLAAFLYTLP